MAVNVAALTGAVADMAAIETAFQANWDTLDHMSQPKRRVCIVRTNLAAAGTLILLVRSTTPTGAGAAVWTPSAAGSFLVPAKFTTAADDWTEARFVIGANCWSGLVVHASAACTVQIYTVEV